jgi:hypothetical protein
MGQFVEEIDELLNEFVLMYRRERDIDIDPNVEPKLPSTINEDPVWAAHYFLLAATLQDGAIIRRSENGRILLNHLYEHFGDRLITICEPHLFETELARLENSEFYDNLGDLKTIPITLSLINDFVQNEEPKGNLIEYSKGFKHPDDFAKDLTSKIERKGIRFREKAWMYLRWMTRGDPDLGIFNFDKRDLSMPLTTPSLRVAVARGLTIDSKAASELVADRLRSGKEVDEKWWSEIEAIEGLRLKITGFVREKLFFSDDPTIADYPFFILGRWLFGLDLDIEELEKSLTLFVKIHRQIKRPPITYPVLGLCRRSHNVRPSTATSRCRNSELMKSPFKGTLEPEIAQFLSKDKFWYEHEPLQFHLLIGPQKVIEHTPDFILPTTTIEGKKKLDLEPHGRRYSKTRDRVRFSTFRQVYQDYFKLIIITDKLPSFFHKNTHYDLCWNTDPQHEDYYRKKLKDLKWQNKQRL